MTPARLNVNKDGVCDENRQTFEDRCDAATGLNSADPVGIGESVGGDLSGLMHLAPVVFGGAAFDSRVDEVG